MARISKNIYYNIDDSNLTVKTPNFVFYFSSDLNKQRFEERIEKNRESLKYNFVSRFRIDFEANDYFDFILYSKIEKRGFKIVNKNGGVITCLELAKLNGEIKTLKSCNA